MKNGIRPTLFKDYVGQKQAKQILEILVASAKKRSGVLDHILLSGPSGLGKTTLARILAAEMGANLHEIVAPNIQFPDQISALLMQVKQGDLILVDEIHGLARPCEEILYSAMEDGQIPIVQQGFNDLMKSIGAGSAQPQSITYKLPSFTLLGATTLKGLLSAPLKSRFVQSIQLEPYGLEDLQTIVMGAAKRIGFKITKTGAMEVAKRSRNTARVAIGNLLWVKEFCLAQDSQGTRQTVQDSFALKDIDENGLGKLDRQYLSVLVSARSAVGLSAICASLGEDEKTITDCIEPYLLQCGYIRRASRGRIAEPKAFELLSERVTA